MWKWTSPSKGALVSIVTEVVVSAVIKTFTSAELLDKESYEIAVTIGIFEYETVDGNTYVPEDVFEYVKLPTISLKSSLEQYSNIGFRLM